MSVSGMDIEALLASGKITDDTDVTEIAALLNGEGATPAKVAAETDETEGDGEGGETAQAKATADAAAQAVADAAAAAAKDVTQSGAPSGTAQVTEPEGPIATESGNGTIPYAVLKGTRERLADAQERLRQREAEKAEDTRQITALREQLEAARTAPTKATAREVQDVADRAGVTDAAGNKVDVTKIDVESLRGEFPEAVVNIIAALQQAVVGHEATISTLRKREDGRIAEEQLTEEQLLQRDIDSVPQLATWAADKDPKMFDKAIRFDNALLADPEWRGKSRVDRYNEVVRLITGVSPTVESTTTTPAKETSAPAQVRTTVSAALQRAAARAAPTSLSDLPAGSPAAQSETQAVEGMDAVEIAAKMQDMTQAQQDAFLARFA